MARTDNTPLLLLLDINMPRVDGVGVLQAVKADPKLARLPVIMLTTTDDPREVDRCYQLGCSVYVTKPVQYQDFVDAAPLDLVYVADHTRMHLVPAALREAYAYAAAGAMAQNVYLYCASAGLATVIRAWFDRDALTKAMGLGTDQQLLLAQTVGQPKASAPG